VRKQVSRSVVKFGSTYVVLDGGEFVSTLDPRCNVLVWCHTML